MRSEEWWWRRIIFESAPIPYFYKILKDFSNIRKSNLSNVSLAVAPYRPRRGNAIKLSEICDDFC